MSKLASPAGIQSAPEGGYGKMGVRGSVRPGLVP